MPYYFYDATYILVLIGALISMFASWNVQNTFRTYSRVWNSRNIPAQDIAQMILHDAGIYDVRIERIRGDLTEGIRTVKTAFFFCTVGQYRLPAFLADYRTGTDPGMVRVTGDRYSVICICGSFPADHTSGGNRCFSPCHSDPRSKTALWRSGITGCEKSPDSRSTYLCGSTCIGDPAAGSTDPDFQTE